MRMFIAALMFVVFLLILLFAIIISCRLIELIWIMIYEISEPFLCPRRRRQPWPIELCNLLSCLCENTIYGCSICCLNIRRRIEIRKNKIKKKFKVEPIIYDNVHIIIMNPNNHFVLGTKSEIVNN